MVTSALDLQSLVDEAQAKGMTESEPVSDLRMGHIHLHVARLEPAIVFYHTALGLNLIHRYGNQAAFLAAGDYHHHVGINTWAGVGAPAPSDASPGLRHFTLAFPSREGLEATVRQLRARGAEVEESEEEYPDARSIREPHHARRPRVHSDLSVERFHDDRADGGPMDPEQKKMTLRTLTYGMHVAGAADGEELAAGAINWISQASFAPPLVMVALRRESNLHRLVERSQRLAVNVLTGEQRTLAAEFFKPSHVEADRIQGFAFRRGSFSGAPILQDAWAWFEARVTDMVKRGDHTVFVAEVVDAGIREGTFHPLVMWETDWTYGG